MPEFPVVIISGPQGSGKSRIAAVVAAELARLGTVCTIVDEWDGRSALPAGAVVTTNVPVPDICSPDESADQARAA